MGGKHYKLDTFCMYRYTQYRPGGDLTGEPGCTGLTAGVCCTGVCCMHCQACHVENERDNRDGI